MTARPTRQLVKDNRLPHVGIYVASCPPFWNSLTHMGQGFPDYYINASFVDRQRYILAQCPTPDTIDDFVGMIMTNMVRRVVVLCNPDTEPEALAWWQPQHYRRRNYTLMCVADKLQEDTLHCRVDNVNQAVDDVWSFDVHHFRTWTDCGRALPDAAKLWSLVDRVGPASERSPVLVHCLMGLNRSGAFATLHHFANCPPQAKTQGELWLEVQQFVNSCRGGQRNAFLSYGPYLEMVVNMLAQRHNLASPSASSTSHQQQQQ